MAGMNLLKRMQCQAELGKLVVGLRLAKRIVSAPTNESLSYP